MDCLRELNDGSASSSASSSSWSGGRAPNAGAAAYPLPWLLLDLHQLLREATPAQAERNARQQEQLYNDVQKAAEDKRQGRKMAARLFGAIGGRGRGGNCGELADLLCSNEGMLELFAVSIDHMDGHAAEGVMGAVWEQFGRRARTLQSLQSSLGSGSSQQQDTAATPPPPPPAAVAAAEKAAQALRACKRLTFTQLQFDYNWSVHGADIAASLQGASVLGHSLAAGTRRLAAALLEHYATAGVHIWMVWNQWDFIPDAQIWIHDIAWVAGARCSCHQHQRGGGAWSRGGQWSERTPALLPYLPPSQSQNTPNWPTPLPSHCRMLLVRGPGSAGRHRGPTAAASFLPARQHGGNPAGPASSCWHGPA